MADIIENNSLINSDHALQHYIAISLSQSESVDSDGVGVGGKVKDIMESRNGDVENVRQY